VLAGFKRIPVRRNVDPDPPRLFRGYKRIIEHPQEYKNFNGTVKVYQKRLRHSVKRASARNRVQRK